MRKIFVALFGLVLALGVLAAPSYAEDPPAACSYYSSWFHAETPSMIDWQGGPNYRYEMWGDALIHKLLSTNCADRVRVAVNLHCRERVGASWVPVNCGYDGEIRLLRNGVQVGSATQIDLGSSGVDGETSIYGAYQNMLCGEHRGAGYSFRAAFAGTWYLVDNPWGPSFGHSNC